MSVGDNLEKELFNEALELPDQERAAYLMGACRGDEALRARVERLLTSHEKAEGALGTTGARDPGTVLSEMPPPEEPGLLIGRYKLLERLGEGGFGAVWLAEQKEPVRRKVALKIIKLGMDTKQVVARFEAERQALALMDHPNIAKVLDAGTTEAGRPYFVMELVRGIPITRFCDENQMATRDRLELFIKVCQAIQHAHQKGVIHRDIKPSNILVTLHDSVPVPKVIDFGIAKATQGELTDKTIHTQFQQFIGTPAYMSPEQAEMSGLDIDTRSDIYGLGVVLYELLTGKTPFDSQELIRSGLDQMRRTIREKEPMRPSTRLESLQGDERTTAAKRRGIDPGKLAHFLRGDLDWIVMKALEKDRSRRYDTANGLAADLRRHLQNEPVVARPPSAVYRLGKLVRRNKLAFAASACIGVVLLLGTVVSTWQAVRAREAKRGAESEKIRAQNAEDAALSKSKVAEKQRRRADEAAFALRQNLYEADVLLAHHAVEEGTLALAMRLLNKHRPGPGEPDLRGWEWRYLWGLCQSEELRVFAHNTNWTYSLALSSDGTRLAAAGRSGAVKLWEYPSGQLLDVPESKDAYGSVTMNPEGTLLAFATRKRGIILWNIPARREITNLPGVYGNQWASALQFSPDGKTLAAARSIDQFDWRVPDVALWDVQTKTLSTLKGQSGFIHAFAFSFDGRTLATGSFDGTIFLWSLPSGEEAARFTHDQADGPVKSVAFSADGRILASGTWSGRIGIWDVSSKQQIALLTNHSHVGTSLAFSPDLPLLASGGGDHFIKLWDTNRWQEVSTLKGSPDEIWALVFSADGKTLISGGKDSAIRTWNATPKIRKPDSLIRPPDVVRWGLRDGILFSTHTNGTIHYRDAATLRVNAKHDWPDGHRTNSIADDFAPSGKLAWANKQNEIVVWDLADRRQLARAPWVPGGGKSLRFSPDERYLAGIAPESGILTVWDLENDAREIARLPKSPDLAGYTDNAINFSRDGQLLAVGTFDDQKVEVWNLARKERVAFWQASQEPIGGVSFLPDGKRLATISGDATARLWEIETRQVLRTFAPTRNSFYSLAITPDGQRIAAGTVEGFIKIWNEATGRGVATLKTKAAGTVYALQFVPPDGNTLVALTSEGVRVWRAPSWPEIEAAERSAKVPMP